MAPTWDLPITSIQGNYFSFRCQSGGLRLIDPPSTRRKIGRGCHHFRKYSHSLDHVPGSNTNLFLRPLFMNFLSDTVPSLLPHIACHFQKRSTKRVWISKRSVLIAWRLGGPESSTHMIFFCGRMGVCGIGSIICVLLLMSKDTKYLYHNWMGI